MIFTPIPIEFILKQASINWAEARYGRLKDWLDDHALVALAKDKIWNCNEVPPPEELELSLLGHRDIWKIADLLDQLARSEPLTAEEAIKDKWLFLLLAWIWENRSQHIDPFREISILWAAFGHPKEINNLITYLPPADGYRPQGHSTAENIARLGQLWEAYLAKKKMEFRNQGEGLR